MKASWQKYRLDFRFTAITSRDSLTCKDTYYIKVWDERQPETCGIGEAGLFRGLSCDDRPDYEDVLTQVCDNIERYSADDTEALAEYPSIRFSVETALRDFAGGCRHRLFDTRWTNGKSDIEINGLIWMGDRDTMRTRIEDKLAEGFKCIKVKIGGIDFEEEMQLLNYLRSLAPDIEIRLDANGAFRPQDAPGRLERLARIGIHSIEQPVRQGQWDTLGRICADSPIPIALDEELIGLNDDDSRCRMLDTIRPAYIILKPTLTGGFAASDRWIGFAKERGIGWWATSALESNIGLNAIAQWVSTYDTSMPQGLGTGLLYHNNIQSPLTLTGDRLRYDSEKSWGTI